MQIKNNTFVVRYKDDAMIDVEDVKATHDFAISHTKGMPIPVLLHMGQYSTVTPSAREYVQQLNSPPAIAEALVVSSLAQRLIVNSYMLFRRLRNPVKVFRKEEDAWKWLASFHTQPLAAASF